jgi:hypothetical protein
MKKAMLLFVSLLFTTGANAAAHFDFANIADTEGEAGFASYVRMENGVTLTATATASKAPAFAYLDAGNAGLGVCKVLDGADQCNPGNDDNTQMGEQLKLTFDQNITLGLVDFINGAHKNDFDGTMSVGSFLNGVWSFADYALADMIDFGLEGSMFTFLNTSPGNDNDEQFYISSLNAEVPVPAALFLFAPALLGFFGLRRKASLAA